MKLKTSKSKDLSKKADEKQKKILEMLKSIQKQAKVTAIDILPQGTGIEFQYNIVKVEGCVL